MKKYLLFSVILGVAFIIGIRWRETPHREPIVITAYASEAKLSLDDLITAADVIAVGNFVGFHSSRWSTLNGKLPENATLEWVSRQRIIIFKDSDFQVTQYIKGNKQKEIISIRTLGGKVDEDEMIVSDEPVYEPGKTYLLFLFLETGPTAKVAPGAYYGTSFPYEVRDGKVVSARDEWALEDLIAYIEKTLSGEVLPVDGATVETPITDTPLSTPVFTETLTVIETPQPTEFLTETPFPEKTSTPTP